MSPLDAGQMAPLLDGAAGLGLTLTAGQVEQFGRYLAVLQAWNQRLNLTAISDPAEIQTRHFVDSLSCVLATGDLSACRLIDVGSGAGFPGVPLKILFPQLELALVESVAKKARFLEALAAELSLDGVTILAERAEQLGRDPSHRERYDWAVARAVAPLRVLVEYLLPLCRPGGHALAQKGSAAAEEVAQAADAIRLLGGASAAPVGVQLPGEADTRYLVVIDKVAPTPDAYPRRPGMPAKRPL